MATSTAEEGQEKTRRIDFVLLRMFLHSMDTDQLERGN